MGGPQYLEHIFHPDLERNRRNYKAMMTPQKPKPRRKHRNLSETSYGRRRLAKARAKNRSVREAKKREIAIERMLATTEERHGKVFFVDRARIAANRRWGAK